MTTAEDAGIGGLRWSGWPWWAVLAFGLLTIGVGVLAIVWPGVTLLVLAIILGIYMIFFGVFWIVASFTEEIGHKWLLVIGGIIGVLAGIIILARPIQGTRVVIIVIGAYWLVFGIVQLITSIFGHNIEHRGWSIVSSLLSIAAGIITLSWPQITALAFAWLAGIWLILIGAVEIGRAFEIRRTQAALEG